MKDKELICKKIYRLMEYYDELKGFAEVSFEEYANNLLIKRAIERQIQLIVECATDINNMILKQLSDLPAKDYFSSFIELAEQDILNMDFALEIAPSTGLRNILVHEYQKIDDRIVFNSIDKIFQYYKQYIKAISSYIGC